MKFGVDMLAAKRLKRRLRPVVAFVLLTAVSRKDNLLNPRPAIPVAP